ncbi:M20/M25/M40 family metallo-hydrolase [Rhizobiaceae bacterium BDR2-2]|uniref:M20/M25/M40 family metallo-hydrolase n=1 Tax=Ectorhizobium quercum TaxID=2965071 RepID=A0AAE3N276_9HYPH|nr:M20/M25/M40 family metallo-hydrolase [Ectorhizobium quercum]MCX8997935.1 M20/M25/M40 family metallo-hydrolase [Ectorhizobium quercum]
MTLMMNEERMQRRAALRRRALACGDLVADMTRRLVRVPSETPPSDTRAVRDVAAALAGTIPSIEIGLHMAEEPVANLVGRLKGTRPGPRIILSGHLDTYPAGPAGLWSGDPFDGRSEGGFLYGRGSCDMKGGIAASIMAMRLIAEETPDFPGEIVLALAGDEEAMSERGTQTLIDALPECRGDAVIVPDVGSPHILRLGEKGMIWLRLEAAGRASHGAHVHRGENAVESLLVALAALKTLESIRTDPAHPAVAVMDAAQPVSEPLGGAGEKETMSRVTVNIGRIGGGTSPNLVPDHAWAELDIRLPAGVSVATVEARIDALLSPVPSVSLEITRRYEPTWTDENAPIVRCARAVATELLEEPVIVNMRVGASDARLWRRAGMPTIVCGLTPYNLGAADEKLDIAELPKLTALLALTVLDFLHTPNPG